MAHGTPRVCTGYHCLREAVNVVRFCVSCRRVFSFAREHPRHLARQAIDLSVTSVQRFSSFGPAKLTVRVSFFARPPTATMRPRRPGPNCNWTALAGPRRPRLPATSLQHPCRSARVGGFSTTAAAFSDLRPLTPLFVQRSYAAVTNRCHTPSRPGHRIATCVALGSRAATRVRPAYPRHLPA
jgi:hypothetical protein